jgi:hypothetical protein
LRQEVLAELSAGLRARNIDACALVPDSSEPPVARIDLRARDASYVEVAARDSATGERLTRPVELERVPLDGRAFAIGVAADELLRVNWTRVALEPKAAPPPKPEPDPESQPRTDVAPEPARPSGVLHPTWVGARLALELYRAGQTQWGPEAFLRQRLTERWGLELGVGMREAFVVPSPEGNIESDVFGGSLGLFFIPWQSELLAVDVFVGATYASVTFEGRAAPEAEGRRDSAPVSASRFGLGLSLGTGPLVARMAGGVGAPIATHEASANGRVVTGVAGLEGHFSLGMGGAF